MFKKHEIQKKILKSRYFDVYVDYSLWKIIQFRNRGNKLCGLVLS